MTVEDLQRLHELQQLDSAIDEREALLNAIDDGTDALAQLKQAQAELEELEEELRQMRSHQRKLELDLEGVEEEKQEKTDRAYGGMVSDPKELTALEKKIEELGRNAARHEDMVLELMEQIETLDARRADQAEEVERLENEHRSIVAHYEETTKRAREEIEECGEVREQLVAELPDDLLRQYEQLRLRHGGVGVAVMRNGTCVMCNVGVPRARWSRIAEGTSIIRCESCQRILVIPGEQ